MPKNMLIRIRWIRIRNTDKEYASCVVFANRREGKSELPMTVPDFICRDVPEVYRRTAGKEPFLQ
jgi:hypothetical protein